MHKGGTHNRKLCEWALSVWSERDRSYSAYVTCVATVKWRVARDYARFFWVTWFSGSGEHVYTHGAFLHTKDSEGELLQGLNLLPVTLTR